MAAKGTNVGKLTVTIDGDTKGLEKATGRTKRSLQTIERGARNTGRKVTEHFKAQAAAMATAAAATLTVTAAIAAFQRAVAQVTALDHLSQSTGIAIERLDELRGIALQTGIAFDTLTQAAQDFGVRMSSELQSATSMGSQAIRALGVDVRDAAGNIRQFDDILPEVAEKFAQFADGSNKAALAAALFGEEVGPKLIPLLNRGRAGLEELRRQIGRTITREDAARVREYQEAIGRLQIAFERFIRELALAASPVVTKLLEQLADYLQNINDINAGLNSHNQEVRTVAGAYQITQEKLKDLKAEAEAIQGSLAFQTLGIGKQRFEELTAEIAKQQFVLREIRKEWDKLRAANPPEPPRRDDRPEAPTLDPLALERAQFAVDQLMERMLGTRTILDEMNFAWATHGDRVKAAVEKISAAQEAGFRRDRAIAQAKAALAKKEQDDILNTASVAAQAITAIWPQQKGAAIAAAVINTAVAVTKALTSAVYPWNMAQAALVAATGAAQIASIRSTNVDGTGGSAAPVSGGGTPQQPVEPEQQQPGRSLFIQGIDPAALFSGRQVEELIRSINTEVQNGATLISTRNLPI